MHALRWVLILPAAIVAWYLTLLLGVGMHGVLDALCPADQMISGLCAAEWHRGAEDSVIALGAGVAATLIVCISTMLAPSHKRWVAIITFFCGMAVAIVMGISSGEFAALAAAVTAGAATLWILLRRHSVSSH